jgi:hypothetical protein
VVSESVPKKWHLKKERGQPYVYEDHSRQRDSSVKTPGQVIYSKEQLKEACVP